MSADAGEAGGTFADARAGAWMEDARSLSGPPPPPPGYKAGAAPATAATAGEQGDCSVQVGWALFCDPRSAPRVTSRPARANLKTASDS